MKKILIFFYMMLITAILYGCDYFYELYVDNGTEVVSIDLITYYDLSHTENTDGNIISDYINVIEALSENEIVNFLDELSKIGGQSSKAEQVSNIPEGIGVRLTYIDGGITIITIDDDYNVIFNGDYDSDLNLERGFGIEDQQDMISEFLLLMDKYFEYDF